MNTARVFCEDFCKILVYTTSKRRGKGSIKNLKPNGEKDVTSTEITSEGILKEYGDPRRLGDIVSRGETGKCPILCYLCQSDRQCQFRTRQVPPAKGFCDHLWVGKCQETIERKIIALWRRDGVSDIKTPKARRAA